MKHLKRKKLLLLANKLIEKLPDPGNAKEHYESSFRNKNTKSVKQSRIITYQPKTSDTADIKSVITGHSKTLFEIKLKHKLSKTIRQAEKAS